MIRQCNTKFKQGDYVVVWINNKWNVGKVISGEWEILQVRLTCPENVIYVTPDPDNIEWVPRKEVV